MDRHEEIELIRASDLFDANWYLSINEDVAAADRDPATHYYEDGARERRDPGPNFSTAYYLESCPELESSNLNPLIHYILIGAAEGRATKPDEYWTFRHGQENVELYNLISASELFDEDWYKQQYLGDYGYPPDPIAHYLIDGHKINNDPGPKFSTSYYLKHNPDVQQAGMNPLLHYIIAGKAEGRTPVEPSLTLNEYIIKGTPQRRPIRIYDEHSDRKSIFLITDSLNKKSFFGGVGTALLLASAMSQKIDADLTVLVRDDETDLSLYRSLMRCHELDFPAQPVKVINTERPSGSVPYSKSHIYLTTSWWTTRSLLSSVPPEQIIYLIQEDERMFYAHGNAHLNAEEVMSNERIRFIVNTKLLHEHLVKSIGESFSKQSRWFEPAFPNTSYFVKKREDSKRQFLFYARPNTDRNLFIRGLEVIEESILKGYLDESWDIKFIGAGIPKLTLPKNLSYESIEGANWERYLSYVRRTDLALSLMYTPHPSYPPLDVVACGGVVVTNKFGNKTSLSQYSENLICMQLDVPSLVNGIRRGIDLACDKQTRDHNFSKQQLCRSWKYSFAGVLEELV